MCIEKALANSGVAKEDVNYINAYASSTSMGDLNEYRALIHCFGKNPEVGGKQIYLIPKLSDLQYSSRIANVCS